MSQTTPRGPAQPKMNMTPMIDVTFQLIIFFMIINNIVAQQNVEMIVPDLEEPKTRELLDVEEVIVNVAPLDYDTDDREEDPLLISGEASRVHVDSLDPFQPGNTTGITQAVEESVALKKAKDEEAEVELLLRADAALFYRAVQPVMAAITGAGIAKVNLVAYLPKDGGDVATADGGGE